jgi:general secretion pathway protein J
MSNRNKKSICGHAGFTLVEILIAIFILSVVMATVYASYSGILTGSRDMEEEMENYRMVRISMDRMIKDLSSLQSSAGSFDLRADRKTLNRRDFHWLSFWSASHLAFDEHQTAQRPAAISYDVRENDDGQGFSLWRSDVSGSKPEESRDLPGGFIICKNIEVFRLTFYDAAGMETDSWDTSSSGKGGAGMPPAAVKIELFLANAKQTEKPYKFMTKVYFPVNK